MPQIDSQYWIGSIKPGTTSLRKSFKYYILSHVKIQSFWKTQTLSKSPQTKFKTRFRPLESFYSTTGRFLFCQKKNFGQIGQFFTIFERLLEVFLGLSME